MKRLKQKIKETNKLADDLIKDAKTSNSSLYEWLEIDFKKVTLKNGHCVLILLGCILLYIL
tara:strand:- start:666 stop:848 length:183 start_codon:yes stop_codon:yes gene_type:complete